ncbi:hypothetical protein FOJ82_02495 [Tessaracoccus rhinocerotis]|uniref:Uncharacterized protein n=1 Tax=Tessaracoccus rhinocerotis TaxID=1689449 RepID=A0A553K4Y2_9ACTN|nr:SIS domain-containing protein [Tessaracoccus rhinocerotis]TRY19769.1 hypothetical protein FOJ82_02495 [Tessaracoccus rhinocerotis]
MTRPSFDDARLEAPEVQDSPALRWLAETGARIRRATMSEPLGDIDGADRPRGVLVIGQEARLVRAVLEPVCPVPFMAWPGPSLPAWVGPLDLVIILGNHDASPWEVDCAGEAARRGATIIVAAPADSTLGAAASSSATTVVPATDADPMAAAVAVLGLLGQRELGPAFEPEQVADAADLVAGLCSPFHEIGSNPAKDCAIGLAEGLPLVWGGTVLAARASRRIAEAMRRASGRPALAADADELETILRAVTPRDPFEDPYLSDVEAPPVLMLLDEDKVPDRLNGVARRLSNIAESVGVRVCSISSGEPGLESSDVERYVTLLQHGRYAAAYLGIGLNSSS